jgi:hypothetical protein
MLASFLESLRFLKKKKSSVLAEDFGGACFGRFWEGF